MYARYIKLGEKNQKRRKVNRTENATLNTSSLFIPEEGPEISSSSIGVRLLLLLAGGGRAQVSAETDWLTMLPTLVFLLPSG